MGILSRKSLVALIWASAALATPLVAEPIYGRDLEIRQTDTTCPTSYETKNGMNFTTYCEHNNPMNDALDPFETDSMQDCMEHCSRYWGNGEGCFGVVWREDKQCWLRNSTTSTAGLVDDTGIHSALVESKDMKALDTDCPATDLSTHTLDNIGYTVHCGKVIGNYDTCWEGYPSCLQSPFIGFYHATSLDDCLNICIKEHPLCRAVSYNPGLEIGFANCWPKTGFGKTLDDPTSNQGILHSATITSLDQIDTTCPSDTSYTATGNKNFDIHCGQLNTGTNITSIHTQNITSCLDACATSDDKCVGVVFDSGLTGGYQNCYLQNTTSVIQDQVQATYAVLSGTTLPSSTSTSLPNGQNGGNNSSSDSSSSKAWIAGPVIGGLAGLAIIGFALFWWRRRKNRAAAAGPSPMEKDGGYGAAPAYTPYGGGPQYNAPPDAPPSELGGDHTRGELATVEHKPSTKYAHAAPDTPGHAPQELAA